MNARNKNWLNRDKQNTCIDKCRALMKRIYFQGFIFISKDSWQTITGQKFRLTPDLARGP